MFRSMGLALCLSVATPLVVQAQKPSVAEGEAPADDRAQLKAMIVNLQMALLEREKENAILRGALVDLQKAALATAVEAMDPSVKNSLDQGVKKALGLDKPPATQTPNK